jgi:hypothetical protein
MFFAEKMGGVRVPRVGRMQGDIYATWSVKAKTKKTLQRGSNCLSLLTLAVVITVSVNAAKLEQLLVDAMSHW